MSKLQSLLSFTVVLMIIHWTLVITCFSVTWIRYNAVEVMDPDFSGTDQSWISVNMTYVYMYAVVRPTK